MRIAVCDDIDQECSNICTHIKKYIFDVQTTVYDNGNILICDHMNHRFDLIILDVIMPEIDGLEVAKKIRKFDKKTPIVFITSSEEFAVQSYQVLAFDYILKPIEENQIKRCIDRFLAMKTNDHVITVGYSGVDTKIRISNIIYIESRLHNVIFHISGNRSLEITAKLSDFENLTEKYSLCRCHKSYIVNIANVNKISGEVFTMVDGAVIKISRSYYPNAKKAYFDFVFGGDGIE